MLIEDEEDEASDEELIQPYSKHSYHQDTLQSNTQLHSRRSNILRTVLAATVTSESHRCLFLDLGTQASSPAKKSSSRKVDSKSVSHYHGHSDDGVSRLEGEEEDDEDELAY